MGPLQDALKNFGIVRLALTAAVLLGAASGFYSLANYFSKQDMALLYGNVDMMDASKIVQKLETLNIPVELRGGGTQIFVPEDKVDRMRLEMAEMGIPKSGTVGYEIFDREESLGTSSFVQNINQLRALEGELSRTIGSIAQVSSARVHLVLPKRKLFSRDHEHPSASIMLSLSSPGRLPTGKVAAIQQLVAAAVPDLSPEHVSIVDDRGNLLARADIDQEVLAANSLDERRVAYENRLSQTIESLISKYVGDGKVRAEVSVEMDYDRFTENSETFDPNGQVVRSSQSVNTGDQEEGTGAQPVTAASNQPVTGASSGDKTSSKSSRKEETLNYEVSKKSKTYVHESGAIKKLSVAVMVDGVYVPIKDKPPSYHARPEPEMKQLSTLVQNAIGFDAKRGDVVSVVNMQFAPVDDAGIVAKEPPMFEFSRADIVRVVEVVVFGILGILALLLFIRPTIYKILEGLPKALEGSDKTMALDSQGSTLALSSPNDQTKAVIEGSGSSQMVTVDKVEGQLQASSLKAVNDIVNEHTDAAVGVIRNWVGKKD